MSTMHLQNAKECVKVDFSLQEEPFGAVGKPLYEKRSNEQFGQGMSRNLFYELVYCMLYNHHGT